MPEEEVTGSRSDLRTMGTAVPLSELQVGLVCFLMYYLPAPLSY